MLGAWRAAALLAAALAHGNGIAEEGADKGAGKPMPIIPPEMTEPSAEMRRGASEAARSALEKSRSIDVPAFEQPTLDADGQAKLKAAADAARERGVARYEQMLREAAREQVKAQAGDPEATAEPVEAIAGLVVLAISSSMPQQMVADYMAQLDGRKDAVVVLRGFIGGAQEVKPTGRWMEKATRLTPSTHEGGHYVVKTIVDPLLFRQLGIERVPAVAYLDGVSEIGHCDDEDFAAAVVVYGAAHVSAALQRAKEEGATIPESVLASYRPKRWEKSQ